MEMDTYIRENYTLSDIQSKYEEPKSVATACLGGDSGTRGKGERAPLGGMDQRRFPWAAEVGLTLDLLIHWV